MRIEKGIIIRLNYSTITTTTISYWWLFYQVNPAHTWVRLFYLLLLQPFNGLFSRTTWVSQYQKGKTNLDFTGARDSEWQSHQLGHMQVCTSLQTDNHASTPPLFFYRPDALPAAQPTASKQGKALKIRIFYLLQNKISGFFTDQ